MQINLKQTEIELALRAFVVAQGISLHGKDLTITFTAGRRESGITADISIEDVEIPGYTNAPAESTPVPVNYTKAPVVALAAVASNEDPAPVAEAAVIEPEVVAADETVETGEVVVESKATVSLFG